MSDLLKLEIAAQGMLGWRQLAPEAESDTCFVGVIVGLSLLAIDARLRAAQQAESAGNEYRGRFSAQGAADRL